MHDEDHRKIPLNPLAGRVAHCIGPPFHGRAACRAKPPLHPLEKGEVISVAATHRVKNFGSSSRINMMAAVSSPAFLYTTTLFAGLYVVQEFAGVSFPRAVENQRVQP